MKFDLCQKNRAKELLLSENRPVWHLVEQVECEHAQWRLIGRADTCNDEYI